MDLADADRLLADVEAAYGRFDPVAWPDPWGMGEVPPEAYERVTDPERYRVQWYRVQAWGEALAARGVDVSEAVDDQARAVRMCGAVPGAVPLFLRLHEVETATGPLPFVRFAFGDPASSIGVQPDCGCDACDRGSEDLIRHLDQVLRSAITGVLEVHRTARCTKVEMIDTSSSGSTDDTRLPLGHWHGPAWL